jgi:two-component system sensor histidine kinase HydH
LALGLLGVSAYVYGLAQGTVWAARGRDVLWSAVLGAVLSLSGVGLIVGLFQQAARARAQTQEAQLLGMLGRLAAVMAQELRSPLASAREHTRLLAEMLEDGSRLQRRAQYVDQEIVRVEKLTHELSSFVRSGRVQPRVCDPTVLARQAAARVECPEGIEVLAQHAPVQWVLDPGALEQVLTNLLRNAVQAQPAAPGALVLTVTLRGEELYFSVRDHGPGLPKDVDPFAPFVTTKVTGTGLGLTVARQIVQAHGGRIQGRTHPDGGALLELWIPPADAPRR